MSTLGYQLAILNMLVNLKIGNSQCLIHPLSTTKVELMITDYFFYCLYQIILAVVDGLQHFKETWQVPGESQIKQSLLRFVSWQRLPVHLDQLCRLY